MNDTSPSFSESHAPDVATSSKARGVRLRRRWRFGVPIAYKLAIAITLLITLGMGLLGFVVVSNQQQLMRDQINGYGSTVVQQLAYASTEPVLSDDRLNLQVLIKNFSANSSVFGAAVISDKGQMLAKVGLLQVRRAR